MSNELTEREKIIDDIYTNPRYGYGSLRETTEQAKKKDSTITFAEVKKYLDKIESRQINYKVKSQNSFVSKHKLYEIQMDLVDMGNRAKTADKYRYALVAIDTFTKVAWGVPMKTKKPVEVMEAFKEILSKIGNPQYIYTDREGAFESKEFVKLLNEKKIKHIISASGAPQIERFNRTLKEGIFKRMDDLKQERNKWLEHFENVINKYNNTKHSTIEMKPNEAKIDTNHMNVKWELFNKAKRNRNYKEISTNDNVRVMETKDPKKKGYEAKFSKEVFKVIGIQNGQYLVNNNKRKAYLRHELMKIDD